jgi:hypothetical protein
MRAVASALVLVSGSILMLAGCSPLNMLESARGVILGLGFVLIITGLVAWVITSLRDKDQMDAMPILREQFSAWLAATLRDKDRT